MPHSSGGGSHGGGSHHSSSHHSSSSRSSSSGTRSYSSVRRSYYPGSRRYRYSSFGRTRYIYSSSDPRSEFSPLRLFVLIFYLPFFLVCGAMIVASVKNIRPKVVDKMIIADEASVISNSSELEATFNEFYKRSGIQPSIVTVYNEKWNERYGDLESYAYDRYLDEFDDEMHWLIVYSIPKYDGSENWSWEGMQGDDTDNVLDPHVTARFTNSMQNKLENSNSDVGQAINDSLQMILPDVKKPGIFSALGKMVPSLLVLLFVTFHAYIMTGIGKLKYRRAVLDEDDSSYYSGGSGYTADRFGTSSGYGSSDRFGTSSKYGTSDSFGTSSKYGTSDRFGTSSKYSTSDSFGTSSKYGTSDSFGTSSKYSTSDSFGTSSKYSTSGGYEPSVKYSSDDGLTCSYCGAKYHKGDKRCPMCKTKIDDF